MLTVIRFLNFLMVRRSIIDMGQFIGRGVRGGPPLVILHVAMCFQSKIATNTRGGYRILQKGGFGPAIRKAGVGVGGAVRFRHDVKSRRGVCVLYTSGRHDTKGGGEGGGCLAEEGEVPYMKGWGGGCNPPPPPPPHRIRH